MLTSNLSACPSDGFPTAQKLPKTNTFPELSRQVVGPSFFQCVQVLVIISICVFKQQLYNFKKDEHDNAYWGSLS